MGSDSDVSLPLGGWTQEQRTDLEFLLEDAEIPYHWEGDAAVTVPRSAEERVRALISYLSSPRPAAVQPATDDLPACEKAEPPALMPPSQRPPGTDPGSAPPFSLFWRDVVRSLHVWRRDPRLPVLALGIAASEGALDALGVIYKEGALLLLTSLLSVLLLGFLGAERCWYVIVDRDGHPSLGEIRHLTQRLWRRYFGLAVYAFVLILLPMLAAWIALFDHPLARTLTLSVVFLMLAFALTFATAALAFADLKAGDAFRHSLTVIRSTWPACTWYVVAAPLAIELVVRVLPGNTTSLPARLGLGLITAVIALVCRGATVFFYTDRYLIVADEAPATGPEEALPS